MKQHFLLTTLLLACALQANAEPKLDTYGLRIGYGSENGSDMVSAEAMVYFDHEWSWDLSDLVELEIQPEASLGFINGHGETAGTVHLGLAAFIELDDFPLEIVLSTGPTLITDDTFDTFDLGGNLQFTSAAGIDWELNDDWTLGYRFQHISNASIRSTNPGLNLHVLAVAREF